MAQDISKMETTAVEWVYNELLRLEMLDGYGMFEIFQQAEAMEKEQIVNAWMATDNELQRLAAEQYYNKTYNK